MNGSVLAPAAAAAPTGVVASPRVPLGVITVAGRAWRYPFTPEDVLWTARFIVGEAGGRDNRENRAVIWAMLNRYALFTYRVHRSFQAFIRAYSTTLQPVLNSKGAARRHMHSASFVHTGGEYPEQARPRGRVPCGQLRRHLVLQRTAWSALPLQARQLALQALSGQSANPGIGNASEFAETGVYYHDRYQRRPSYDEWVRFSQDFPRSAGKAWTWIGPVEGLTQYRNNTFYLANRARHLPAGAVRVVPPAATAEEAELAPTGTAQTPVNRGSQAYVRWVQGALNQILGLRLATDGVAGAQTSSAIRGFQQRQKLKADGIVGPKTEAALRAALTGSGGRPNNATPLAVAAPSGGACEVINRFDFDRPDIKLDAHHQGQVRRIAQRLVDVSRGAPAPLPARVIGHTDNAGTETYNERLGLQRAEQVRRALPQTMEQIQVGSSRRVTFLPAETRGEREPAPGATNAAEHRRVQVCFPSNPSPVPPRPLPVTHTIRVVVKSFIARIGPRIGAPTCSMILPVPIPIPLPVPLVTTPQMRLRALATATDAQFSENPLTDRKDKAYRLFSACTFTVACLDGKLVSFRPSILDRDAGQEGRIQAPPLVPISFKTTRTGPSSFSFSWEIKGRPHPSVEPGFQLICSRSSVFIWHTIQGNIDCSGPTPRVTTLLGGSRFPSHRVFVNGVPDRSLAQGVLTNLWHSHPSDATLVQ